MDIRQQEFETCSTFPHMSFRFGLPSMNSNLTCSLRFTTLLDVGNAWQGGILQTSKNGGVMYRDVVGFVNQTTGIMDRHGQVLYHFFLVSTCKYLIVNESVPESSRFPGRSVIVEFCSRCPDKLQTQVFVAKRICFYVTKHN